MNNPAIQLFNALFRPEDGQIELRAIKVGTAGLCGRAFVSPGDETAIQRFIAQYGDVEVYFGPAARRDSSSGSLENCTTLAAIFSDVDLKTNPDGLRRIREFPFEPSALVASGGGYHPYWILKEPVNLQEENGRAKSILQRVARFIGGDDASAEPVHILRVPGTLNHKPTYPKPRPVELLSLSEVRYSLSDFEDFLPAEPEPMNGNGNKKTPFDTASALKGVPEGKRDETCFKLACKLRNADVPFDMALELVLGAAARCQPAFPADTARVKVESAYRRYEPKEKRKETKETEFQYIEFAPTFLAVEDPPVQYIVNELLPEGIIALAHGDPRTRKSWAALEIAVAVSTGTPAFGMERFKVECPFSVLYSSQEDAAPIVRPRTKAILQGRGITDWPETLAFSVHKGINLESHEWHEALIRDVLRYGFRLVILDPIRRYAPNADKGPAEVRAITQFLRRLTVETGATVKIVHHDVKPKTDNRDDRRRSHKASGGDWFAAAECPIAFEAVGENSTLVIPEDYKISTDPEPFSFRLETDDPRTPTWGRLIGETSSAEDTKFLAMQQKILDCLAGHSGGLSGSAIAKLIKIRKDDVLGSLDKLLQSGEVDSYGGGGRGRKQTWFLKQKDEK